jgi:hypothetical protein
MKIALACALVIASVTTASAQTNIWGQSMGTGNGLYGTGSNPNSHYVSPHTNSNGTYVGGYNATNPNNTQLDNYGTRGNVNPYTGTVGRRGAQY